jgi:hypothetical protein
MLQCTLRSAELCFQVTENAFDIETWQSRRSKMLCRSETASVWDDVQLKMVEHV